MRDIRNKELKVGHIVAFADRNGNVARMRTGEVVALFPDTNQLRIRWDNNGTGPVESTVSLSGVYVNRPRISIIDTA